MGSFVRGSKIQPTIAFIVIDIGLLPPPGGWSSLRVNPRFNVSTCTTTVHWQDDILRPNNASGVVHQGILDSEPYNLTVC